MQSPRFYHWNQSESLESQIWSKTIEYEGDWSILFSFSNILLPQPKIYHYLPKCINITDCKTNHKIHHHHRHAKQEESENQFCYQSRVWIIEKYVDEVKFSKKHCKNLDARVPQFSVKKSISSKVYKRLHK